MACPMRPSPMNPTFMLIPSCFEDASYRPEFEDWKRRPMPALGQKQERAVQEPMSAMSQKRTFARVAMFYSVLNGLLVLGHRSLPWQTSPQKSKSAVLMKMATPLAAATGLPLKRFTSHFLTAPRVRPRLATPRRLHSPKLSCKNSIAKDAEWASVSSRVA